MIWVVTTIKEKESFVPKAKWDTIKEAIKDAKLLVVTNIADIGDISENDIVIVQTRDMDVINAIKESGALHTAESFETIELTYDKEISKSYLKRCGVLFPKTVKIEEIQDGCEYFVKPLHGENSIGVDYDSLCTNKEQVKKKCLNIKDIGDEPLIEEFINGEECTVGVICDNGQIKTYPIIIKHKGKYGIFTNKVKFSEDEHSEAIYSQALKDAAEKAFKAIGGRKYMRIDFKVKNSQPYCIDFNLFPGLGKTDHLADCVRLCCGMSYKDMLFKIISLAGK